jgi:hypothetical protein
VNPTPKKLTDAALEKVAHDFMNDPAFAHIREEEKLWDSIIGEGLEGCEAELEKFAEEESRWVRFPTPKITIQIHRTNNPAYDGMPYVRFDDIPKEYRSHIAESANGSGCPAPLGEEKICLYEGDVERWLRAIAVRVQFVE